MNREAHQRAHHLTWWATHFCPIGQTNTIEYKRLRKRIPFPPFSVGTSHFGLISFSVSSKKHDPENLRIPRVNSVMAEIEIVRAIRRAATALRPEQMLPQEYSPEEISEGRGPPPLN